MGVQIIVALIGAFTSIAVAIFSSGYFVNKKIEDIAVVTAGAVDLRGNVDRREGLPFTVNPLGTGKYRVNFREPFPNKPIVVAISDGGQKGSFAEIIGVDTTGFTIEGRDYATHGLAEIGFQFIAVKAKQ